MSSAFPEVATARGAESPDQPLKTASRSSIDAGCGHTEVWGRADGLLPFGPFLMCMAARVVGYSIHGRTVLASARLCLIACDDLNILEWFFLLFSIVVAMDIIHA
jgi:hypothetical protein